MGSSLVDAQEFRKIRLGRRKSNFCPDLIGKEPNQSHATQENSMRIETKVHMVGLLFLSLPLLTL